MNKKSENRSSGNNPQKARESSTGWIIKSLGDYLDKQVEIGLKPFGLSIGQFSIMMTLLENDGLMQVEIGQRLSMPGSAITRNIDRLEALDYAKRHNHKTSRRSYRVCITDKGTVIAYQLSSLIKDVNEHLLSSFNEKDKRRFQTLLHYLHKQVALECEDKSPTTIKK